MNVIQKILLFFAIFATYSTFDRSQVEAAKFLAVLPWPGKSHYIVSSALLKGLVAKGHEVTVINPFPQQKPIKNYHDIPVPGAIKAIQGEISNLFLWHGSSLIGNYIHLFEMGYRATVATLKEPKVQELLHSNQTFDAIICEIFVSEALYGFSEHFNAPLIGFSSMGAVSWNTEMIGSPSPPSYVPHIFLPLTERMTLWQRLANLAFITVEKLYMDFLYMPRQAALYREYFPQAKRSLQEVRKNAALMLMNQHVSLSFSRPYMPNQIEVGGMHINRNRKPLPEDIKKFIDDSKHGVIYFSMGSNLKSKDLPLHKRQAVLDTFRGLKQRVLWKFEEPNLEGKPDNVFISDWFPQDDILAHPNVKLFITHGGLLSTTESIYHGKPVIGIPIFGDQFLNMERAERYGYGIMLDYADLTLKTFQTAIERMLKDPSYTKVVTEMSRRFRDQPMQPLDLAVYWTEHVVRHKGAEYLHCAGLDLNFIEYHNLDAMLILYGGLALVLTLVIWIFFKVFKRVFGKSKTVEYQKVKKN